MLIQIPFSHIIDIDITKLIQHCDETQLNELILLADKKLKMIEQDANYSNDAEKQLSNNYKLKEI